VRRLVQWAGIAAVIAAALTLGAGPDGGNGLTADADRVAAGLRCPVCQGLSVKDSDSPTARDIRADIRRRLDDGQTPTDVRQAYVDRYGQWILLRPETSGFAALVWVLPAAVTAAGGVVVAGAFLRWRRSRRRAPTEEERRLVAVAVARAAEAET